ncbi:MAG: QueT transporter family protein [Clostridiaceae bacterium]|nr:QueT transporter family protein [Eubacteriales bacterium]
MSVKAIVRGALIGALYVLLTLAVQPISSGLMQLRVSEALCVLPYFTPAAVPGLFIGCLTANLVMGNPLPDVVFGSLATLLSAAAACGMKRLNWSKWLVPLPAVLINAAVVGYLLTYVYKMGVPWGISALYVAAGQALSCYALGMPLFLGLERFGKRLFD